MQIIKTHEIEEIVKFLKFCSHISTINARYIGGDYITQNFEMGGVNKEGTEYWRNFDDIYNNLGDAGKDMLDYFTTNKDDIIQIDAIVEEKTMNYDTETHTIQETEIIVDNETIIIREIVTL